MLVGRSSCFQDEVTCNGESTAEAGLPQAGRGLAAASCWCILLVAAPAWTSEGPCWEPLLGPVAKGLADLDALHEACPS